MRVLFLTHTVPYPPVSGERIRTWSLMRELRERGWSVSLFALGPEEGAQAPAELAEVCGDLLVASPRLRARARMLASIVRRRAFHETMYLDAGAAERLRAWPALAQADVLVTSLFTFPYVAAELRRRTVLDPHNAEGRRLASMAAALGRTPRGLAARLQVGPVTRFEADAVRSVARTLAVSREEAALFESYAPGRVDVVPNGVDPDERRFRAEPPADPEILFVGSLDYGANVDAVRFLAGAIAPLLGTPAARLTVVGSNPAPAVRSAAEAAPIPVDVKGHVPSVEPHFRAARALAVPLRFGGGTRLKILEALARGVPVVTTSIGCEGLELEDGRHLLVADEPGDFARALDRVLADDELCRTLAAAGFAAVRQRYSWHAAGEVLHDALARVAAAAGSRP